MRSPARTVPPSTTTLITPARRTSPASASRPSISAILLKAGHCPTAYSPKPNVWPANTNSFTFTSRSPKCPRKADSKYGRMREPALFMTSLVRALDIKTDGVFPLQLIVDMNTQLFSPPTIFSYFPADFRIFNGALPAAEFGIYGTSAYVTRTNTVNRLVVSTFGPQLADFSLRPDPTVPGATGTYFPTMAAFLADTADAPTYVQRLNRLFFHNAMSAATKATMTNAIAAIPASNALGRAKMGAYLALTSLAYQIQK